MDRFGSPEIAPAKGRPRENQSGRSFKLRVSFYLILFLLALQEREEKQYRNLMGKRHKEKENVISIVTKKLFFCVIDFLVLFFQSAMESFTKKCGFLIGIIIFDK